MKQFVLALVVTVGLVASCRSTVPGTAPTMQGPDGQAATIVLYAHGGCPAERPATTRDFWIAAWPSGEAVLRPSFAEDHVRATVPPDVVEACSLEIWSAIKEVPLNLRLAVRNGVPGMAVAVRRDGADRVLAFSEGEEAQHIEGALERCEQAIQLLIQRHERSGPPDWNEYSWKLPEPHGERASDREHTQKSR